MGVTFRTKPILSLALIALIGGVYVATYRSHSVESKNPFTMDEEHVYFAGTPLQPRVISPKTFSILIKLSDYDWIIKDAQGVYEVRATTGATSSEPLLESTGLLPLDPTTVRALGSSDLPQPSPGPDVRFYLADRWRVFCLNNPGELWLIPADPATFSFIPYGALYKKDPSQSRCAVYTKDKDKVFYAGDEVSGADPATFRIIDMSRGEDASHVYYKHAVLEVEDPKN